MDKVERLKSILLENLAFLEAQSGGSTLVRPHRFELQAIDYLGFAEEELERGTPVSLVNCVSHLKRAMDCRIDTYLENLNLYELVRRRNLKFQKKMEFIGTIGIYNARSLERLNRMRNRMEHDYEIPKIEDLQVYFDLVAAFISVLEFAAIQDEVYLQGMVRNTLRTFEIAYDVDSPSIEVKWGDAEHEETLTTSANHEIAEFAYYLRVLLALCRMFTGAISYKQVLSLIEM